MKIQFKGIVRGTYSHYVAEGAISPQESPVATFIGNSLEEVVAGLALPEWIYTLHVNGRRIANPERYLKSKGIWNKCIREEVA